MDAERYAEKHLATRDYGPRLRALLLAQDLLPEALRATLLAGPTKDDDGNRNMEIEKRGALCAS